MLKQLYTDCVQKILYLTQELTDDFRLNYCRLWQALLNRDRESIRRYCLELNAGEKLYRLLACMITARAWDNVDRGITNSKRTKVEVSTCTNMYWF